MERDGERQVRGQRLELANEPRDLVRVEDAVFRNVAVEAYDGDERSEQSPVDIGLGHRRARGVLRLGHLRPWLRCAKVPDEAIERLLRGDRVAVVVPRHGEDRSQVVLVRQVELGVVLRDLPVEVHAVAEHIEEGRVDGRIGRTRHEVLLEALRDPLLRHREIDPAQVAVDVEDQALRLRDRRAVVSGERVFQSRWNGGLPVDFGSGWKALPGRRASEGEPLLVEPRAAEDVRSGRRSTPCRRLLGGHGTPSVRPMVRYLSATDQRPRSAYDSDSCFAVQAANLKERCREEDGLRWRLRKLSGPGSRSAMRAA